MFKFLLISWLSFQAGPKPDELAQILKHQAALQQNPSSEDDMAGLAAVLFRSNQNDKAIELLEPFVARYPDADRARLFLAFGYAQMEQYERARNLSQSVVIRRPADHYARHVLALALLGLNRFSEAESALREAISLKEDFAESHFQLALLQSRNPETMEQSYASLKRASQLGGDQTAIQKALGSVCIKLRRYDEAIGYLKASLESGGESSEVWFLLADAYRKSGKAEDAGTATRNFQRLSSQETQNKTRLARAQALYQEGMDILAKSDDLAGAYERFRSAVDAYPSLDAGYYRMAQIHYLRRQYARGIELIRSAIELNGSEAEYHFVLARCLEATDPGAALDAIRSAVLLNNRVADFHNVMGTLLEKKADFAGAIRSYRSAIALEPETAVYHLNLSFALARIGEKAESDKERLIYERLSSKPRLLDNDHPARLDLL